MEDAESPLDVLSRAATMVQETQNALNNTSSDDASKHSSNKQLPTAKWKRDRRSSRLPDYSRKSEPKSPETSDSSPESSEAPLDMSVRQRGLPPSYTQTINNPGYRSSYRPSVIHNNPREELPPGISMCDPIIDEHFRRSLGKDYLTLFSNNNKEAIKVIEKKKNAATTNEKIIELMDSSGLSVDDHFAKALGDTWVKLNKKEEIKATNSESNCNNSLVTI